MATEMKPPPTATTRSSIYDSELEEKTVSSTHQRSASSSSHESDAANEGDLQQDDAPPLEPSKSNAEPEYPPLKKSIPVIVALILSIFLLALDRTIIATAIPQITDEFHSLGDIGWYGSAFMLTSCGFQLLLGRIYTFYAPKIVYLIVIFIFEVGSLICAVAPNSIAFIFGRAIAGMGSAGIMSGAVVLLVSVVPLKKRPVFQGLFGATFGVASVVGPLLGGVFTTDVSWRWCFYINLPIGGIAIVVITLLLKPIEATNKGLTLRQQLSKLDLLGELFLLPCVICLLLALQWGGSTYAFSDGRIIALFTLFGVLLVGFVLVQIFMQSTATIPARVISNRSIIGGMWYIFCSASTMLLIVYYLPLWFQAIKGNSAVESGVRTIPLVLALVVGTISAGQITGRIGYYNPMLYGAAVLMPIGAGLLTTFNVNTPEPVWIGYQILFGFGLGIGMQQPTMAAQTVLKRQDVPIGVSLMFFCQMLGGAIAVSVGQNVLDSHLVASFTSAVKGLTAQEIVNTGATDLRKVVPAADLPQVLVLYNSALRQAFIVALAFSCIACLGAALVEWRSVKGQQGPLEKKPNTPEPEVEKTVETKEAVGDEKV